MNEAAVPRPLPALPMRLAVMLALWFALPRFLFVPATSGLDPSWQIALNLARVQELVFGRDFVFTYGPLGFLSTRLDFPGTLGWILLSDAVVIAAFGLCLWQVSARLTRWHEVVGVVLAFAALPPTLYLVDLSIALLALLLFFLLLHLQTGSFPALWGAQVLSVFSFFLKLNVGLIAIALNLALAFWLIWRKPERRLIYLADLGVLALALWLCALGLHTELVPYIEASTHIAAGYNDAMFVRTPYLQQMWMAQVVLVAGLIAAGRGALAARSVNEWAPIAGVGLGLFVLFKQSFVRGDAHVYCFFGYASILFVVWYVFSKPAMRWWVGPAAALTVGLSLYQVQVNQQGFDPGFLAGPFSRPFGVLADKSVRVPTLPAELVSKLKEGTVDIIPWEVSLAWHHELVWAPRPVMQTYSAYDGYLDGLNASKYASPTGPLHVLFSPEAIDNRYPFFDEAQTKLRLLSHYRVEQRLPEHLLFRRAPTASTLKLTPHSEGRARFGQPLQVPQADGLLWLEADLEYTPRGAARRIVYQPPELRMTLTLADGSTREHRGIAPILKAGVVINRFSTSLDDAERFFTRDFAALPAITSITLDCTPMWGFNREFGYRFKVIELD